MDKFTKTEGKMRYNITSLRRVREYIRHILQAEQSHMPELLEELLTDEDCPLSWDDAIVIKASEIQDWEIMCPKEAPVRPSPYDCSKPRQI